MVKELQNVGKSFPRLGAFEKATGKAKYTVDMQQPGMLYCKVLRSPYTHALILNVDTKRAAKLKGVKAVLTYQDVPKVMVSEIGPADTYILADKARYCGDEVAAVAAETEEIAERALELIKVKYKELPGIFTMEESLKPGAILIPPKETSPGNLLKAPPRTTSRDWGDIQQGFREADFIVENEISASAVQHMTLEPKAYLATWENDQLTMWASSQHLFGMRTGIARALNLPENHVRVISQYVGGGFGGKGDQLRMVLITALLSRITKRPVKLSLTREEDMLSVSRPHAGAYVRLGLKKDATFTAIEGKLTVLGGGYNGAITAGCTTSSLRALYRCNNCRFDAISVYTNHSPSGQLRGIMNSIMAFAVTQAIDMAAEEMNFPNPMEFIKKTHIQVGDLCDTINDRPGCTLSSCGLDECMDKGAEAISWHKYWKGWKVPVEFRGNKRIGIGMSAFAHDSAAAGMVSGAILKVNMDGTADFYTPVGEIGNGAATTQTQVIAEASGIPFQDIHVIMADTALVPTDPHGIVCSSTAHIRSLASQSAGLDARRQLLENASHQLNAEPEDLAIENGKIYIISNPAKSITLRHLMGQMQSGGVTPVIGRGSAHCPRYPQKAFNYGAHFALVEVDTETGQIKVLNYVAAHDLGKAINPAICNTQIRGGVTMGLSIALVEGLIFDYAGKILNLNTTDYKIYTSADSPQITPLIIETNDPLGAYGAKGFAESPMVGVAGCISNAIYNALGIRFKEIPITPEKVLTALKTIVGL